MKKIAAIALLSAAALSLAPAPAMAGGKEKALIGGFIGGLIIGHAITESHRSACPPEPAPVVVIDSRNDDCGGYWREERVQVWVPGYWVVSYDCGRRIRRHVGGHHEYRTNRVWVSDGRRDHRDNGRRGRDRRDDRGDRYVYNR